MNNPRCFGSDNFAGVHPDILKAIEVANEGHVHGYGDDPYTHEAVVKFKEIFGQDIEVFFVFAGTPANVLGLTALTQPYNAIICAETAHINVDECGAPEKYTGCKLLTVKTSTGKLTVDLVKAHVNNIGVEHHVQAKVISITQATELGTVYSIDEVKALADYAHSSGLLLHMDGARIANAAVTLGQDVKTFTKDAGVDVLSFGGTKNGMMFGEAIIFFNPKLAENFKFIRKQGMQLYSKMRFISAQFTALLSNDLWKRNAQHSNDMAQQLATALKDISQIVITREVQANGVFAAIPNRIIPKLQEKYFFYVWDEKAETSEVRWMTSWDTTEDDIREFVTLVKQVIAA